MSFLLLLSEFETNIFINNVITTGVAYGLSELSEISTAVASSSLFIDNELESNFTSYSVEDSNDITFDFAVNEYAFSEEATTQTFNEYIVINNTVTTSVLRDKLFIFSMYTKVNDQHAFNFEVGTAVMNYVFSLIETTTTQVVPNYNVAINNYINTAVSGFIVFNFPITTAVRSQQIFNNILTTKVNDILVINNELSTATTGFELIDSNSITTDINDDLFINNEISTFVNSSTSVEVVHVRQAVS